MKCFEQTVGVKKDRKSCDTVLLIFYCCKFKVSVSTDIFPQTNWLILQIIVCGFICMFVHHNLARNSIIIINFQKTSFRLLFFGFDILYCTCKKIALHNCELLSSKTRWMRVLLIGKQTKLYWRSSMVVRILIVSWASN